MQLCDDLRPTLESSRNEMRSGARTGSFPRRVGLALLGAAAAFGFLSSFQDGQGPLKPVFQDGDDRPSVVLIMADDHRFDMVGASGRASIETPNLDRLATEGAYFERAYVTSSLSCPSRASLFTGKYAHRMGVHFNDLNRNFLAKHWGLADLLQRKGYQTAFLGKWHFDEQTDGARRGFGEWASVRRRGKHHAARLDVNGSLEWAEDFLADELANRATEYIKERGGKPFCLVLWLKGSNQPFEPAERHLRSLHELKFPEMPSRDDGEGKVPAQWLAARKDSMYEPPVEIGQSIEDAWRRYQELALATDEVVGHVLDTLEAEGRTRDTLVLFSSDGGYLWGEHGFYRKRLPYEPAIRVPLLARFPGTIPAGQRVQEIVSTVDLLPTLVDYGEADLPADLDGKSLRGLMEGKEGAKVRDSLLYVTPYSNVHQGPLELAVVESDWKYIRMRDGEISEALFHTAEDFDERNDVHGDPANAERLAEMRATMQRLLKEHQAPEGWWDAAEASER